MEIGGYWEDIKIYDCYNNGQISGSAQVGGIIGYLDNSDTVENKVARCYNIGELSGSSDVGWIAGIARDTTFTNCYYPAEWWIVGNEYSGVTYKYCYEKTDAQLKNMTLGSNWKADTNNINNGYPILSWQE